MMTTQLLHRAVYEIVPRRDPALRVEVAYSSDVDGALVVLAPHSNTAAQRWLAVENPLSPGSFALVPEVAGSRALTWVRDSPAVQIWSRQHEAGSNDGTIVCQNIFVVPATEEGSNGNGWSTLYCKQYRPRNRHPTEGTSTLDNSNNNSGDADHGNSDAEAVAKLVVVNGASAATTPKRDAGELTLAWHRTGGSEESSADAPPHAFQGSTSGDDEVVAQHVKLVEKSRVWTLDTCEEILSSHLTAVEEFPFRTRVVLPADVHKVIRGINESCRRNTAVFIDAAFPCDESSLNGREFPCEARVSGRVPDVLPCDWLRPAQLSTAAPKMAPSTNLLRRTQLPQNHGGIAGYDYFGVLLDVIVTSPSLRGAFLDSLVVPSEYNPFGVYAVRMFLNQRECYVIVDDHLPVRSGDACFLRCCDDDEGGSGGGGNEDRKRCNWWASIIQKACAKALGSYYHLHKDVEVDGFADAKLEALLEALSNGRSLRSSTNDGAWQRVLAQNVGTNGGCCAAWTIDASANTAGFSGLGLLAGHPYTVLGLITDANDSDAITATKHNERAATTLVKLRHPYHSNNSDKGTTEWRGQWSHTDNASWSAASEVIRSQRCTAASSPLPRRHNGDRDADAAPHFFCMSIRDFGRYFNTIATVTVPTKTLSHEAVVEGSWLPHTCLQRDDALGNMHALLTLEEEGRPFEITVSRIDGVVGYQAPLRAAVYLMGTLEPPERPQLLTNPLATSPWAYRTTTVSVPAGTPRGGGVFVVIVPLLCGDIVPADPTALISPSSDDERNTAGDRNGNAVFPLRVTHPSFRIHVCSATNITLKMLPHPHIRTLHLPWNMSESLASPTVPMQLVVGSNHHSSAKRWSVPGVLMCDATPLNPQPLNCRDVFSTTVDRAAGIVTVKRTDSLSGWEQPLRLRCTVRSRIQLVVSSHTPVSISVNAASTPSEHGCYEIAPRHAPELRLSVDSILKDHAAHNNNGVPIRLEPHNGCASQRFRLKQCATGVYLVYSAFAPTKALQCTALHTTPLELWDAVPTNAVQQFSFQPTSDGYGRIARPGGKGVIEVTGAGREGAGLQTVQATSSVATPHAEFQLIAAPTTAESAVVSVLLLDRAGKAIVLTSGRFPQTISSVELPPGTYHLCLYCSAPQEFLNILVTSATEVKCTAA